MKRNGISACLVILSVLTVLVATPGCKKKQRQQAGGEGEQIRLSALAEIENYKEILRKDPNNLQALIGIGNLYYDTNQDLLAIENYQKALAMDPSNANVRTDMAVCYRRRGNPDRAVEELKKAISTNPRHPQSRYNLGVILIHDKNDVEGGVKAWEALLENVPDYPYRDQLRAEIARTRSIPPPTQPKYK
jgi:tetratricopeptide (TPR) repeat protein